MKLRTFLYAIIVATLPAQAAMCGPRNEIVGAITGEKFKESRVGIGIIGKSTVMEVYASAGGETWTILLTTPNGITCILTTGKGWQQFKAEPAGMKA